MRNSVVLPEPLGPTRPTFSPGLSWKEASTNRTCRPYCLLMREKEIISRASPAVQLTTTVSGCSLARDCGMMARNFLPSRAMSKSFHVAAGFKAKSGIGAPTSSAGCVRTGTAMRRPSAAR